MLTVMVTAHNCSFVRIMMPTLSHCGKCKTCMVECQELDIFRTHAILVCLCKPVTSCDASCCELLVVPCGPGLPSWCSWKTLCTCTEVSVTMHAWDASYMRELFWMCNVQHVIGVWQHFTVFATQGLSKCWLAIKTPMFSINLSA